MKASLVMLFVLVFPAVLFSATIKVPQDYLTIQAAIDASVNGDTVLVGPGTYFENIDFLGKAILVQGEQGPDLTVIDGSQSGHVVYFHSQEGTGSVLEGFTITNGNDSKGGGIYCWKSGPVVTGCVIRGNEAYWGGGFYCSFAAILIEKCVVADNKALSGGGGTFWETPGHLVNVVVAENTADMGGGLMVEMSWPVVFNCTLSANTATGAGGGGGVKCIGGYPNITNSILWGNSTEIDVDLGSGPTVSYSDVKGGWPGVANIDEDPLFKDPGTGDYHLEWNSPCINRGTGSDAPPDDIDGDSRPAMGTVDMGADEFTGLHALGADKFCLSEATGGTVDFFLFGGAPNGGRSYLLLGSVSGTAPGIALPGGKAVLPLNFDVFTNVVIALLNTSVFQSFSGSLTWGTSTGWAQLDTLGPIPGTAGITMSFAYALVGPWDFASNPINVEIQP